jgi:hypothetical protein
VASISIIGMTGWVNPYSRLPGALGPSSSYRGGLRTPFFIGKLWQVRDLFWLIRHSMETFDLLIPSSLHMHREQHVAPCRPIGSGVPSSVRPAGATRQLSGPPGALCLVRPVDRTG